jgi:hypothetical protein
MGRAKRGTEKMEVRRSAGVQSGEFEGVRGGGEEWRV